MAKSKISDLIAEEIARSYAERTQADVKAHIKETLVDVLQLGDNAASNGNQNSLYPAPGNDNDRMI